MFRVKALAAVSALVLTTAPLAACSYEKPAPSVEEPVGLPVDAPRITVESTGTGEKRVLTFNDLDAEQKIKYTVSEGFSQDLLKSSAAQDFNPAKVKSATTTLSLEVSVDKATENVEGQLPATRNVFGSTGVPEYSGNADAASGEGFQFGWRAVDSGQMSSLRLAAPQSGTDEARGITEQAIMKLTSLPVVFPEDAIGRGAKWTVESRVAGESTLLQTTTYTVKELAGDVVKLDVSVQQRPSLGALSFEGQAEGTDLANKELKVLSSTTDSKGELTVDLKQPLPTDGDVSIATKIIYGTEDSDLRVVHSTTTDLQFTPAE